MRQRGSWWGQMRRILRGSGFRGPVAMLAGRRRRQMGSTRAPGWARVWAHLLVFFYFFIQLMQAGNCQQLYINLRLRTPFVVGRLVAGLQRPFLPVWETHAVVVIFSK